MAITIEELRLRIGDDAQVFAFNPDVRYVIAVTKPDLGSATPEIREKMQASFEDMAKEFKEAGIEVTFLISQQPLRIFELHKGPVQ